MPVAARCLLIALARCQKLSNRCDTGGAQGCLQVFLTFMARRLPVSPPGILWPPKARFRPAGQFWDVLGARPGLPIHPPGPGPLGDRLNPSIFGPFRSIPAIMLGTLFRIYPNMGQAPIRPGKQGREFSAGFPRVRRVPGLPGDFGQVSKGIPGAERRTKPQVKCLILPCSPTLHNSPSAPWMLHDAAHGPWFASRTMGDTSRSSARHAPGTKQSNATKRHTAQKVRKDTHPKTPARHERWCYSCTTGGTTVI